MRPFHECDEMGAIHVLYIMYRWNSRSLKSLKTAYHQNQKSCSLYTHLPCFSTLAWLQIWSSSFLPSIFTWFEASWFSPVGIFETKVYATITDNSEELWHQIKQFERNKKHMEFSNACRFLFHTELGHASRTWRLRLIIFLLFLFLLFATH